MRHFGDTERRWLLLFNTSIGVDLRQAIKDNDEFDPCKDGLRSVCWKVFLLNGPLSKASWIKKTKDSRSAYGSLRDHFLKYIDNPNDLHSSADPLVDDESSPWATFRQDEVNREEIWQDVVRCNIDNDFFQEPSTQRKLLDILFIYSKLNPDTGYRQGMHELLAPVLWVVYQDSVDVETVSNNKAGEDGMDFMLNVLDSRYVEHDAFNLFCAIMQTAKTFYEIGESKDSSAIVAHSERIHKELLGAVDPDLCHHLQVIGIVPQIFVIRWLRLLFGREFEFKDVLKLWDILFAENLNVEIVDMACVAILLRLRWQLIDADYTTAITSLTRLNLPKEGDSARAIVKDAVQLIKQKSPEAGADITQLRTGKRQYINPLSEEPLIRTSTPQSRGHRRLKSQQASPSPSPARFSTPQRQLEGLFSNVSNNFQKSAEGWSVQNVSKALRGAVGEARRNMEQFQAGHSRGASVDIARSSIERGPVTSEPQRDLGLQLKKLNERSKALAKMLDTAQETLRKWKADNTQQNMQGEDAFNTALARIQFVSVYLADSDIPIPPTSPVMEKQPQQVLKEASSKDTLSSNPIPSKPDDTGAQSPTPKTDSSGGTKSQDPPPSSTPQDTKTPASAPDPSPVQETEPSSSSSSSPAPPPAAPAPTSTQALNPPQRKSSPSRPNPHPTRPSLAESSFSFMLGEDRHRSSFIRSKPTPEETRSTEAQALALAQAQPQTGKERRDSRDRTSGKLDKRKKKEQRRGSAVSGLSDEDGFTMSTLL